MIDTHVHLWRRSRAQQAGILSARYLQRDAVWRDFVAAWHGLAVERVVGVQVNDFVDGTEEARLFVGEADAAVLGGYVAWAQLERLDVRAGLERLRRMPAVCAVRRTLQIEADPEFCLRGEYVRGARLLGELGLLCELCVRLDQVSALPRLVRECPETTFVLQHMGKPDLSKRPAGYWLRAMEALAALPNLVAKLSVVVHRPDDPPLTAEAVAPFVEHLTDCFGADRLMFGSNWPVSTAVIDYRGWVELMRDLAGGDERLWSGTARRVYGLAGGGAAGGSRRVRSEPSSRPGGISSWPLCAFCWHP